MTTPEDTTQTTDDAELALTAETLDDLDPKDDADSVPGGAKPECTGFLSGC